MIIQKFFVLLPCALIFINVCLLSCCRLCGVIWPKKLSDCVAAACHRCLVPVLPVTCLAKDINVTRGICPFTCQLVYWRACRRHAKLELGNDKGDKPHTLCKKCACLSPWFMPSVCDQTLFQWLVAQLFALLHLSLQGSQSVDVAQCGACGYIVDGGSLLFLGSVLACGLHIVLALLECAAV